MTFREFQTSRSTAGPNCQPPPPGQARGPPRLVPKTWELPTAPLCFALLCLTRLTGPSHDRRYRPAVRQAVFQSSTYFALLCCVSLGSPAPLPTTPIGQPASEQCSVSSGPPGGRGAQPTPNAGLSGGPSTTCLMTRELPTTAAQSARAHTPPHGLGTPAGELPTPALYAGCS